MKIGYARVSTREQHLEQQIEALEKYGCDRIYTEKVSGQSSKRPMLNQVMETLREGDTMVFWRLDRVGRSLIHLEQTITELKSRGVNMVSLKENLDIESATGKVVIEFGQPTHWVGMLPEQAIQLADTLKEHAENLLS